MDAYTRYLVIGPVSVSDLAGNHPDIIAGYPMPTAVAGLGYKLGLDIRRHVGPYFKVAGTAVVVHDHSEQEGHPKNPVTSKADAAPIIDELRARADLSFVLALDVEDDDDFSESYLEDAAELLSRKIPELLFGGGKVFPAFDGTTLVKAADIDQLPDALRKLPAGNVLVDRHDLLEDVVSSGRDTLDALLDIVEFTNVAEEGATEKEWSRRQSGWVVPICVGFQAIETPKIRPRSRINDGVTPHVYGETIYSVGEYRSLRTLLAVQSRNALDGAFWKHCADKNSGTYFVSAMQSN
jgi:CRISPR-associated protein (Cas_Csy2).